MRFKSLLGLLLLVGMIFSCGKIIFREIDCRDFQIQGEGFWFPLDVSDSVVFINSTTDFRWKFTIVDKRISHRTKYTSDTGCGCLDNSKMLLISGSDSIWFNNELRYVEDNEGNYYEDIIFVINGNQSGFYEKAKTNLETYKLDSLTFSDVELYNCEKCDFDLDVKKLYRVKNTGIISFELVNGEKWIYENLSKTGTTTLDSFDYTEDTCD